MNNVFVYKSDVVENIYNEVVPCINVLHSLVHLKLSSQLKTISCLNIFIMVDHIHITHLYLLHSCN